MTNGLFTYGDAGLNGYDSSPYIGLQMPYNVLLWTSTLSKNKQDVWVYRPLDGANGLPGGYITMNSQVYCIVVRTHTP